MTTISQAATSHHQFKTTNFVQNGNIPFLNAPLDVLHLIGKFVGTGTPIEAAKNAVNFGKTCALTHLITHSPSIENILKNGKQHADAIKALANAVLARKLTPEETGIPSSFFQGDRAEADFALWKQADAKIEQFYATFKSYGIQSGIYTNDDQLIDYVKNTLQTISARQEFQKANDPINLPTKINTTKDKFIRKVVVDIMHEYAKQPLINQTPKSFTQKLNFISSITSLSSRKMSAQNIESCFRSAICKYHESSEFQSAIFGLTKQQSDNKEISEIIDFYQTLEKSR